MKIIANTAMILALALAIVTRQKPVHAALPSSIKSMIDTSVDPCDDFYQYSCGNWLKNTQIPATQWSIDSSFDPVADKSSQAISQIVQENHPYVSELWNACTNWDQLNNLGSTPLDPMLQRVNSVKDVTALMYQAGKLFATGTPFMSASGNSPDLKDATKNVWYIGAGSTVLDSGYIMDPQAFKDVETPYRNYITNVMNLAGFGPDGKYQAALDLNTIADKIIAFEKAFASIIPNIDYVDPLAFYKPITIAEASLKYPLTFAAYSQGFGMLQKSSLKPTSNVIYNYFDYFDQAEKLLQQTSVDDLKIYLSYRYISDNAMYLSKAFYDVKFDFFYRTLNGQQNPLPRNQTCAYREQEFLGGVIGNLYYAKMFDQQREDYAKQMVNLVEQAMKDHIANATWLSASTQAAALDKLSKTVNLIGHPAGEIKFPFNFTSDSYFGNIHKMKEYWFSGMLSSLGNTVDRNAWSVSAADADAVNTFQLNQIIFPAGILQPPFFVGTNHPAQNFGSIGTIMGIEVTYGYGSLGRRYDGVGNVVNWWDTASLDQFNQRSQCLADEYSQFVINGQDGKPLGNVNGNQTISTSIVDNGGLALSWDAYHTYMKSASNVATNGVLPEEADQLFFLSFAQTFCQKATDAAMTQNLQGSEIAPGIARVKGAVMNSPQFAATFQCKADSKMNPAKKCKVW